MIYPEKERKHRMKIQVRQSEIAKASKMLKGLISKETLSDFSYVKLEGCGVNITLKGGDCDIQLTCRFGGDTDENGIVLVPGRFLNSFVGVSSGIVDLQTNGTKLKMKSNGNTFNMGIAPDKGYFDMLGVDNEKRVRFVIEGYALKEMLRKVEFARSKESTHPTLKGVNICATRDLLEMTATDGKRLAHVEHVIDLMGYVLDDASDDKIWSCTISDKTVDALMRFLDEEAVTVEFDERAIRITHDKWSLVATLLAGQYPAWQKVVPSEMPHTAEIDRVKLLEALEAASLSCNPNIDGKIVAIDIFDKELRVSSRGDITDAKVVFSQCKVSDGASATFMYNSKLLIDALKCLDCENINFGFGENLPCKITCNIPWCFVAMPIRK